MQVLALGRSKLCSTCIHREISASGKRIFVQRLDASQLREEGHDREHRSQSQRELDVPVVRVAPLIGEPVGARQHGQDHPGAQGGDAPSTPAAATPVRPLATAARIGMVEFSSGRRVALTALTRAPTPPDMSAEPASRHDGFVVAPPRTGPSEAALDAGARSPGSETTATV